MPISQVFKKNIYYQADLLYMPEDQKYKYILVCVDMYDGTIDAEPLKLRDNTNVIKAFKEIFKRKYLDYPLVITLDQGSEFKGDTKAYFESNRTNVKYALTGRHRQLANVERANQKIQSILFKRMASQELLTGEPSLEWVDDLPELVKVFNESKKKRLKKKFQKILSQIITLDQGSEFKGDTKAYFESNRTNVKYPLTGRHRQLANVERANQKIQ